MIILYHCMSARSFRPLWTLEELGLPYELRMLPFPPRALARAYLDVNPLGTIPLLIDGETRMTESAAICQYFEPAAKRQPQIAEDYARWFLARLRTLEPQLASQAHLCAGRFTAADISVGYALLLAEHIGLATKFTPAVQMYWNRLKQRDGYVRALQAQERAARAQGVSVVPAPDTVPT